MKQKPIHLNLAVFDNIQGAQAALQQLPKLNPKHVAAVIVEKDTQGQVRFKDVGLTPLKGAAGGAILGGMVGLLTGGTGLALAALGGVIGQSLGAQEAGFSNGI